MLLFIIRHGDPIYNPDSLTPKGHLQAQSLARRFAVHGLDKIFVSPMIRARQTAQPTCELLGLKPTVEEWMSEERAYSELSIKEPDGTTHWIFQCQNTRIKNNETVKVTDKWYETDEMKRLDTAKAGYERIQTSSDIFLEKLGYKREGSVYKIINPSEQRIAAFCHEGFSMTWMSHLLSIPPHIFWASFAMAHTGVAAFEFKNFEDGYTTPRCLLLSDLSHIYCDRLPLESITSFGVQKL